MNKPLVIVLLVLAILGSAAIIHFAMPGRPPRIQLNPYRALGEVAGQETARLLNHQGEVVIIARDSRGGANPVESAEFKSFRSALKEGGVRVAAIERFSVPPAARFFSGDSVPRDRFLQVLQAHPKMAAFVLFAEFPTLDKPDFDLLRQSGAKIVLISGNPPGCKGLLDAGLAQLAIVPRADSSSTTAKPPQSLRENFDRYYVVLASSNKSGSP